MGAWPEGMRFAVVVLVMACGSGQPAQPDAPPSGPCEYPDYLCLGNGLSAACGNDQIDSCYIVPMPGHCYFFPRDTEVCDGTARPACTDLGYLGGDTACIDCTLDVSGCDACAGTACASLPGFVFTRGLAVSGSHIAARGTSGVAIFEGTTFRARTEIANLAAIVGVAQGFVVATTMPPSLRTLDLAGVLGATQPLPDAATAPALAYGPGNRVLVAWNALVGNQNHVHVALADTAGAIVVPAVPLFATTAAPIDATTDGTSFFVGSDGSLARVAADGTSTIATGFPQAPYDQLRLTWAGTTGWYVAARFAAGNMTVQRFSATGQLAGNLSTRPERHTDYLAHGDKLLMMRTTAAGAVIANHLTVLNTLAGQEHFGFTPDDSGSLARVGTYLVGGWSTEGTLRLSFVPAP